jgi:hypothetical protein
MNDSNRPLPPAEPARPAQAAARLPVPRRGMERRIQGSNDAGDRCLFDYLVGIGQGALRGQDATGPVVAACLFDEGQGRWWQRAACDGNHRHCAHDLRASHETMANPRMDR